MVTSGVRLGTPAGTTRGFGVAEFQKVGDLIARVLDAVAANGGDAVPEEEAALRAEVEALCARFPIY
jgi:glycine hydroxymethyltransferase